MKATKTNKFLIGGLCAAVVAVNLFAQTFNRSEISAQIVNQNNGAPNAAAPSNVVAIGSPSKAVGKTIFVPTIYWGEPNVLPHSSWDAVFAGTVLSVKSEKEIGMGNQLRRFKSGKLKVERVFLDSVGDEIVSPGDIFAGESFEGLRRGDKVIVFNTAVYYENELYRANFVGTNTKMGFKVKSWDEPIVAAIEKIARCAKTLEGTPEGHATDFRVKEYACSGERNEMILRDKQIARVWRKYDPQGFAYLLEAEAMKLENPK